jgi:hypothetical protein
VLGPPLLPLWPAGRIGGGAAAAGRPWQLPPLELWLPPRQGRQLARRQPGGGAAPLAAVSGLAAAGAPGATPMPPAAGTPPITLCVFPDVLLENLLRPQRFLLMRDTWDGWAC